MDSALRLDVDLGARSYPIHIGSGLLDAFSSLLTQQFPKMSHAVIIFDENVAFVANKVAAVCGELGRVTNLEVESGERSKSAGKIEQIWSNMLAEKTDRGSLVIAVGGGVVGDLAGFAAASFARGIPLVQVPTTLLSQVDSSVGGKTGINLPGAKNIVGAFWQPSLVVIDPETLHTLPQREYLSGVAEVVKYGVILLPDLFESLEGNSQRVVAKDPEFLSQIITESCRAKAIVVQEDERETSGRRAILNYGHTFAHAIESSTEYGKLLHGEAVSIGMHMAAILAWQTGRCDQELVVRQKRLLEYLGLPTHFTEVPAVELWKLMQHDKKVEHGELRFGIAYPYRTR